MGCLCSRFSKAAEEPTSLPLPTPVSATPVPAPLSSPVADFEPTPEPEQAPPPPAAPAAAATAPPPPPETDLSWRGWPGLLNHEERAAGVVVGARPLSEDSEPGQAPAPAATKPSRRKRLVNSLFRSSSRSSSSGSSSWTTVKCRTETEESQPLQAPPPPPPPAKIRRKRRGSKKIFRSTSTDTSGSVYSQACSTKSRSTILYHESEDWPAPVRWPEPEHDPAAPAMPAVKIIAATDSEVAEEGPIRGRLLFPQSFEFLRSEWYKL
ncbi:hypothetical protein A1O1_09187 [Capronia coronata CBS 617.96]|uniref:Uncharacterized protein n=1 Tax=Capronia coronata CBS 617.96 TaxID=1182541 RepID=W9XN77_9EURO|nr:uncharacterized protein A1O1_09187 [Capronia coronata CBS 617.96]EXJ78785.1 hypothetical protein A1O1_09187 [Capronia coronata CBS 617.96]